jgi:hypothetical protein
VRTVVVVEVMGLRGSSEGNLGDTIRGATTIHGRRRWLTRPGSNLDRQVDTNHAQWMDGLLSKMVVASTSRSIACSILVGGGHVHLLLYTDMWRGGY